MVCVGVLVCVCVCEGATCSPIMQESFLLITVLIVHLFHEY